MADEAKAKGNAAFAAGRFEEAARHFGDAIALAPDNHVLYSNRSAAHASLGRYSEALADAERTVALRPDWAKGYSVTALKKKENKMKIPRRAHLSAASSLPLSVSLARAARVVAGVHPRLPRHVPFIVACRAALHSFTRPLLIRVEAGLVPRRKP